MKTGPGSSGDAEGLLEVIRQLVRDSGGGVAPDRITLDSRLESDLGLDSLGRSELIARVERSLDLRLPDEALVAPRARDLLALAGRSGGAPSGAGESLLEGASGAGTPAAAETLLDVLDWHLAQHPERIHCLLYGDAPEPTPISYAALAEGAAGVAAGLRDTGLQSGDRVALMLPTCADYYFGFLGILAADGIPVPIYPPARPEQLEDHLRRHAGILNNAGAAILITVPEGRGVARLLRTQVPSLSAVLIPDAFVGSPARAPRAFPAADDIAFLQYTSGSTGQPKGVMLSHADLLANIRAMGEAVAVRPDDRFVSWLPLYHDMGLIGAWLGSLYYGIPLISMSPLAFLARPLRWLQAIHDHRGTLSAAPNFAYELCLKRIDDAELAGLDLSCWRRAMNGAEPVGPRTLEGFARRFAPFGFDGDALAPVYGLAEAAVGLTFPPVGRGPRLDCIDRQRLGEDGYALPVPCDDPEAQAVVSCGAPLAGYRLRVVDGQDSALPERHEGLLQFQGPSATRGYFDNPEATAQLIRDGWHDTGDRAYLAGGELHLTGRVKDMIIRGGRNLYPYELEAAVGELAGVRKGCVAAFAVTDPELGSERLVLVAETRERDSARREDLMRRVRERATDVLGSPPDEIVLAPPRAVLKTSSGKIRRGGTRERYLAGRLETGPRPPAWQLVRLVAAGLTAETGRFLRRLPARLYAAYAWLLFGLLGLTVWLGIMSAPKPAWRWRSIRAGIAVLRRLAFIRLEVSGAESIPPTGQPFVLAANHQSYLDALALIAAIPRPIAFVAKRELADHALMRAPLRRVGTVFVDRFDSLRSGDDMARFRTALDAGQVLGFFPEGTFRDAPGLLPFRMGAFLAAAGTGVPVLPVAIGGTRELMRGSSFFPRPGRARIRIGPPLTPDGDDWAAASRLRDQVRRFILDAEIGRK